MALGATMGASLGHRFKIVDYYEWFMDTIR